MNLILLYPDDFIEEGVVRVSGRRLEHMLEVHRADVGRALRVGLLNGSMGQGIIKEATRAHVIMKVSLTEPPPAPLPVTLLLAMPRPKGFRRIIQCVTTMGVKRIALFGAYRVEKSYWKSPWLEAEALHEQMILGLEQARDTLLPEITLHPLFKPFVEDVVPGLTQGTRCLVAHPGPAGVQAESREPVTVAIGPEGGFTEYELTSLVARGFEPVGLGPRILKTEHAVPAFLGRFLQP